MPAQKARQCASRLIGDAKEDLGDDANHTELQNRFRHKFAEILEWSHRLRKHPVYKKVMTTARDLRDSDGGYDWSEAFHTAVEQRKFLLNRLVPKQQDIADDSDT